MSLKAKGQAEERLEKEKAEMAAQIGALQGEVQGLTEAGRTELERHKRHLEQGVGLK